MNREAQILQALQGELPLAARKALVVELNSIRSQAEQRVAAAREVELGKEAAAAHLTPAPTYVRHTSDTDWLGKVGSVRQAPAEIHQQAKSEAGAWMRQVSALARADHEELRVQAVGYAQVWGSQFGELAAVARDSFLQTASHLAGVKLAAETEYEDDDDAEEAYDDSDDGKESPFGEDGEMEDDEDYDGPRKESRRTARRVTARALSEIAREIENDWGSVNFAARPYLDAMFELNSIDDAYYQDSAKSIVAYFLSNASSWRGETAKRVKDELKAMMSGKSAAAKVGYTNSYGLSDEGPNGLRRGMKVWIEGDIPGTVLFTGFDDITNNLAINPEELGYRMYQDSYPVAVATEGGTRIVQFDALAPARTASKRTSKDDQSWYEDGLTNSNNSGHGWTAMMSGKSAVKSASVRTAASPDFSSYPKGRAQGQEWSTTCSECGETETGTDYYNGWPSQDAFHRHLFCGPIPDGGYQDQDLAIDRYSSLRTAEWEAKSCARCGGNNSSGVDRCAHCGAVMDPSPKRKAGLYPDENAPGVTTWADGYGNWHATADSAEEAKAAIMKELKDRDAAGPGFRLKVVQVGPRHYTEDFPGREASLSLRTAEADGIDSPSPDSQNGYAESTLPDVTPSSAPEDTNLGWISEGDPNADNAPNGTDTSITASLGVFEAMFMSAKTASFDGVPDSTKSMYADKETFPCGLCGKPATHYAYSLDMNASRKAAREGWWPLVPSSKYPGENDLVCPDCGSPDVSISGNNLGRDILRNNLYTTLTCNSCGRRDVLDDRKSASRKHAEADGIDSPSPQSQNGYAESTLPNVEVATAPEDTNLGWITDGDPNADDEAAFEAPDNPIANEASRTAAGPAGFWCPKCKKYQSTRTPAQLKAAREHVPNCQGKKESSLDAHFARLVEAGDNDRPAGEAAYKPTGVDVSVNGYTYYNVTPEDIKTIYEHYRKTDPSASVTKVRGSRRTAAEVTRFDDGHSEWKCSRCKATVYRYRGESDVSCDRCGAEYNAAGQQLRDDWRGNMSNYDDEIGDMEGYEIQHANDDRDYSSQPGWNSAYGSINAHFASLVTAGKAYDKGMADGKIGDGIQYNPYPFDSQDGAEWIRGYRDAQGLQPGQKASSKTAGENDRPAGAAPMVDQVTDEPEDDTDMFGGEWAHDDEVYRDSRTASLKTAMPAPADLGVSIGSIFYSSWGYDQTNVNFYEVVGLTGASVKVREVAKTFVEQNGPGGNKVIPQVGNYIGGEMTKRLRDSGYADAAITINSSETAWLWDGKPKYETDSMYGH